MTGKEFTDTMLPLADGLYRLAYWMLESEADAQDTVQDLFLKLWTSRESLQDIHNPKAYCTTLVRNMCIDRIRKASALKPAPLDESLTAGYESDSDYLMLGKEERERISLAIGRLPERQRTVLQLKLNENLDNGRIADRTGMSGLNVRVQLSLARKKLKKAIR